MSAKIKYTDEELGKLQVIPDFLPSPEALVFKEDTIKISALFISRFNRYQTMPAAAVESTVQSQGYPDRASVACAHKPTPPASFHPECRK